MDPIVKVAGAALLSGAVAIAVSSIGQRGAPAAQPQPVPAYSRALDATLATYAAAAGPRAPKTDVAAAGITLRSVGFEFPTEDSAFPPGPGVGAMAGNCMSCHTPGMILNQPALTLAEWQGEVAKMVKVYKAPVNEADIPAIVTYLASLKVPQ